MADFTNSHTAVDEFINKIRKSLNETKIDAALATIKESAHDPALQSSLSDVIPIITAHINEDIKREKPKLFGCSEKLLDAIAEKFEAEEVLLQLIEDVEKACDDTAFLSLLKPLQTVLLRLPKKRLNSLGWGLNAIHSYLNELPLPENLNLEEDEEILMDADPLVEKISILYVALLPFYDVLIADLKKDEATAKDRKTIVLKFLLQLLGKPLAFLDLKGKSKSRARRVAEALVEKILEVTPDIFWFLELQASRSAYDIGEVEDLSLAVLYYLVLVEEVAVGKIPKVYDRVYVFQQALHLATELFKYDNQFMVHSGLGLSHVLINSVEGLVLSYQLLDSEHHSEFCKALTNIVIYNQIERYRHEGLQIFQRYLFRFETRGRFLLIYNLMKVLNHTGIISYVVTQYKDMLMQEFDKPAPAISPYFSGPKLFALLNVFCSLHKGEESDLVELADQIVASLNLLRFLAIRDKGNATGVWGHFKALELSYLGPLKKGLILSRAHYELKVKEVQAESAQGDRSDSEVSVTVAGRQLSEMPTNEKLRVLYSAMTSFDVMESLLCRVNELIEVGPAVVKYSSKGASTDQTANEEHYEEDIRNQILEASLPFVVELGWSKHAITAGAKAVGYPGITHGMFLKGGGDLVYYFQRTSNQKLVEYLKQIQQQNAEKPLPGRKIIERAVQERLQMIVPYLSRWPQAIAIMSLPPNVANSLATLLTMVDDICYYAGDRSVDFNWYARRVALAGVFKATELYLIQDRSPGHEETWKFLKNRLCELMQVNDLLSKSDFIGLGSKDTVTSAFITARNILGLNWNR